MKNIHYSKILLWICLLFFEMFATINAYSQDSKSKNIQLYTDESFHFSVQIPDGWQTTKNLDDTSFLRILCRSNDSRQALYIYAFKTGDEIDLEKFAEMDTSLFRDLGNRIDSKRIWKFLFFYLTGVERSYQNEKITTKIQFKSEVNFAYLIMWKGYDADFSQFTRFCESFETHVPFFSKLSMWILGSLKGIGGWIIGIIGLILFLGIAYLIGQVGVYIRTQIEIKKQLGKVKKQAIKDGQMVNEKWHKVNKKTSLMILLSPAIIVTIYFIIFSLSSTTVFLVSLAGLVPAILGFFGIFFSPSDDIEDYF